MTNSPLLTSMLTLSRAFRLPYDFVTPLIVSGNDLASDDMVSLYPGLKRSTGAAVAAPVNAMLTNYSSANYSWIISSKRSWSPS